LWNNNYYWKIYKWNKRKGFHFFGKGFYVKTEKLQRRGKGQRAVEQRLENGKA
jgi:hypothetical protein